MVAQRVLGLYRDAMRIVVHKVTMAINTIIWSGRDATISDARGTASHAREDDAD